MSCPICFAASPVRAFVLPCTHTFCDRCAARFLWEKPACAVCRAPVISASPAWAVRNEPPESYAASILVVKHKGVTFEVDLDTNAHECAYERLSAMFQIPIDRLKLIQKGKLLPARGTPDLEDALRPGVMIQLMGSRLEQQLPPAPGPFRCGPRPAQLTCPGLSFCHPLRMTFVALPTVLRCDCQAHQTADARAACSAL